MPADTYVTPTIQASTTTWAQLKTGGLKLVLDKMAAANPAKANPTVQATVAPTGGGATGGLMPAGNYFFAYTWVDGFGETTIGTSRSASVTVGATNIPRITIPALPTGVQSANIYVTPAGGAAGTEQLYATGITTTTFDCATALKADSPGSGLPGANTTGLPNPDFYGLVNSNPEVFLLNMSQFISSMLSGAPMSEREVRIGLLAKVGVLKAWYTALNEIATLAWTNQGSVGYTTPGPGIGMSRSTRTLA
jgi:hypothetical protein